MAQSLTLVGSEVGGVPATALRPPTVASMVLTPSLSPVLLAVIGAGWWYLSAVHRLPTPSARAGAWPRRRTVSFLAGLLLTAWVASAGPAAYASSLFWVWTSQLLTLLLITPVLLVGGQPVELARRRGTGVILGFVDGPIGRLAGNSFIGPALVPVICAALFFGPLAGWAVHWSPLRWVVQILVVILGALIVLPILDVRENRPSIVIGLAMAVGLLELLLDAVPGIVLRLQTHPASTFFDARRPRPWTPGFLPDQQRAGAILWTVAELLDLPFLVLVFLRWARADEREAAAADTVLDAERILRTNATGPAGAPAWRAEPTGDEPWWLSDPAMRDRMRDRRRQPGKGDGWGSGQPGK